MAFPALDRADSLIGSVQGTLEGVRSAPIIVQRPSSEGGRRGTVHNSGRDEILGAAYSDRDEAASITEPDAVLDHPQWVEWRGAPAHEFSVT
ncbi:hypothetical protein [Streptomyces sp. NPDC002640]